MSAVHFSWGKARVGRGVGLEAATDADEADEQADAAPDILRCTLACAPASRDRIPATRTAGGHLHVVGAGAGGPHRQPHRHPYPGAGELLCRPRTKYAIGTTPKELMSAIATAQPGFEPRTSSAGRRARSMSAAIFNTPSNVPPMMINLRVRGLRSIHFFLAIPKACTFCRVRLSVAEVAWSRPWPASVARGQEAGCGRGPPGDLSASRSRGSARVFPPGTSIRRADNSSGPVPPLGRGRLGAPLLGGRDRR
jgi:hypothetical protein